MFARLFRFSPCIFSAVSSLDGSEGGRGGEDVESFNLTLTSGRRDVLWPDHGPPLIRTDSVLNGHSLPALAGFERKGHKEEVPPTVGQRLGGGVAGPEYICTSHPHFYTLLPSHGNLPRAESVVLGLSQHGGTGGATVFKSTARVDEELYAWRTVEAATFVQGGLCLVGCARSG